MFGGRQVYLPYSLTQIFLLTMFEPKLVHKEFSTPWGAPVKRTNHYPKNEAEIWVCNGMKMYSPYRYLAEVDLGRTLDGNKNYRGDGVVIEKKAIISIKSQSVEGTASDKIHKEVTELQGLCYRYGWERGIIVLYDPNDKFGDVKRSFDGNSNTRRIINAPNVEVVYLFDYVKEFMPKVDAETLFKVGRKQVQSVAEIISFYRKP